MIGFLNAFPNPVGQRPVGCYGTRTVRMSVSPGSLSRRDVLFLGLGALPLTLNQSAGAAMYDYSVKGSAFTKVQGDPKKLETWLPQIEAGYDTLVNLESNWNNATKDYDGDIVRRALGTVGVKSPLFNVKKAFEGAWNSKKLADIDIDELEELQDLTDSILNQIASVDFQLYSVNFTELNPTKQRLVEQGKDALDKLLADYKRYLELIKA
ncbi:hypothetical protein NDN08_004601 [Rhodosorus marinus]|uniref:Uncharacterized protein n=1 Tax=Rhodosorus marinus TaxID=101924 RepID=A0AAV8ULR5_9RHOD|nr:hypothetical protein NDN08_004601 [Rhodosorus marinus]